MLGFSSTCCLLLAVLGPGYTLCHHWIAGYLFLGYLGSIQYTDTAVFHDLDIRQVLCPISKSPNKGVIFGLLMFAAGELIQQVLGFLHPCVICLLVYPPFYLEQTTGYIYHNSPTLLAIHQATWPSVVLGYLHL